MILWEGDARQDLEEIFDYIAQDSPVAASETVETILDAVGHLQELPAMGRAGRVPGTRELIVPGIPFLVPYRVKGADVQVLRVFHTAQRSPDHWKRKA